jgi:hypothetical protein
LAGDYLLRVVPRPGIGLSHVELAVDGPAYFLKTAPGQELATGTLISVHHVAG